MNSFLDWLDEAAGGLIRLAYLAAGITAVAVYFGAGTLPTQADVLLNAALPWALAFALETHTYLTSRRVRAAWQERDWNALGVNLGILAVLLAFSSWNQLGYLSGTWTPPHVGPLALPTWAAYGVRACIVPLAFMAAAFLAPLAAPITAQIEGEARGVLADVFKIARKQRKRMLKEAQRSGRDLTGALVELVGDATTRRIIAHAYGAIRPAGSLPENIANEQHYTAEQAIAAVREQLALANYPPIVEAAPEPEPPSGGGGAPATPPATTPLGADEVGNVTPIRRTTRRPAPQRRRAGSETSEQDGSTTPPKRKRVRTARRKVGGNGQSLETTARAAWASGARSVNTMVSATGMSRNAAGGWVRTLKAEQAHVAAATQEGA